MDKSKYSQVAAFRLPSFLFQFLSRAPHQSGLAVELAGTCFHILAKLSALMQRYYLGFYVYTTAAAAAVEVHRLLTDWAHISQTVKGWVLFTILLSLMSEMPRNMRLMSTMVGPSATTRANKRLTKHQKYRNKKYLDGRSLNLFRWQPRVGCDDRSEPVPKSCREFVSPFHESWLSCWVHFVSGWLCVVAPQQK